MSNIRFEKIYPIITIQEYVIEQSSCTSKQKQSYPNTLSCPTCNGGGWYYAEGSHSDPYEGNKFRDWETCRTCKGSGVGPFLSHWKERYYKYRKATKEYNVTSREKNKKIRAALKKLTKEDKKVLNLAD